MKETKLNFCRAIITEYGATYRNHKSTLSVIEKALYEAALQLATKLILPAAQANAVIEEHETLLAAQRDRAEHARAARAGTAQKTEAPAPAASTEGRLIQ
jgi:hypothetical protein